MNRITNLLRRAYDPDPKPDAGAGDGDEGAPDPKAGDEGAPDPKPEPKDDPNDRISVLEAELKRARDEAAKRRIGAKEAKAEKDSLVKSIAKALGIDDGDPDPEKLAADLEATRAENKQLKLGAEFAKAAKAVGADADLAWAVLQTSGEFVSTLDVNSEGISEDLESFLKTAIDHNPKLKQGPGAPAKSGTDIKGGTQKKTFTREEVQAMTPDEINQNWDAISHQMEAGAIR